MKNIFKYLPILLGLVTVLSSCGDDDETEPAVAAASPSLNISVNGSADESTYTVNPNASITIAITANKVTTERDLDVIRIDQNGENALASGTSFELNSATETYDFNSNADVTIKNDDDEIFNVTGVFTNITSSVGITTYTITVTDKDGTATTKSFDLVVESPTVHFSVTKTGSINHIEGRGFGSWSLSTDTTVTKSMSETMADVRNTDVAGDPFTGTFRVGTSRNTTVVVAAAGYDYDNANVTGATTAYDNGTPVTTDITPTLGAIYIFRVDGTVTLVKVTEIDPNYTEALWIGNFGKMSFEYKR
jgi:hypothetical protein